MKKNLLLLLIPVISLAGCKKIVVPEPNELDPYEEYDNVFLLMGQSNASGNAPWSFLETSNPDVYAKYTEGNDKVQISYDNYHTVETNYGPTKFGQADHATLFGPEIGMAETISANYESAYIVKAALGGSVLQTQYVDQHGNKYELYNRFVLFIKNQVEKLEEMGKKPRIRGVFWMQGESDSSDSLCNTYAKATQNFYDYLRTDLNKWIFGHFNFVDAYISTSSHYWKNPTVVNQAKQYVADHNEHYYCIKTNGEDASAISLTLKSQTGQGDDDAHYDAQSMLLLGQTAGTYIIK